MSVAHRLRMGKTGDQICLINSSWEMAAQPSCLPQLQTPTTTGMLKHTHHSSHPAYELQTQWLRHAGTYFSPQQRHPPSAELLTQTGGLRIGWVCTNLWGTACVALQQDLKASTVTLPQRLWFTRKKRCGSLCGTVSICLVKAPLNSHNSGFLNLKTPIIQVRHMQRKQTECGDFSQWLKVELRTTTGGLFHCS